jgi:hypothetical protein
MLLRKSCWGKVYKEIRHYCKDSHVRLLCIVKPQSVPLCSETSRGRNEMPQGKWRCHKCLGKCSVYGKKELCKIYVLSCICGFYVCLIINHLLCN